MSRPSAVVLLSGGLDSTTLLYHLNREGYELHAISIFYGQRHKRELARAEEIASLLKVPHTTLNLEALTPLLSGNALTTPSVAVPHGHYTDESMKITVVPNRNMIFLSLAAALACGKKYDAVAYAAHSGDHAIYPDCRKEFTDAMRNALSLCDWHPPSLLTPFVELSKSAIVRRAVEVHAPLSLTWSCYEGGELHCGACGTCTERKEAFKEAGVSDPTQYIR